MLAEIGVGLLMDGFLLFGANNVFWVLDALILNALILGAIGLKIGQLGWIWVS